MNHLTNLRGVAVQLKLPMAWLRSEAEAGRIPCLRVGRKMKFNLDAVRRVLAKRAAKGNAGAIENEAAR
ncbi:MAG: hypothetical protein AABZ47_10000 [Planctomycetota bacterium]|mgnify:CR=1 FL=1